MASSPSGAGPASPSAPVVLHATFAAVAGQGDAVAALLRGYADVVRAEPGNRAFAASRLRDDPDQFFVYEEYDDATAFRAHLAGAEGADFNAALGPLITTPTSQLTFLTPL